MALIVWRHPKPLGAQGLCLGRTDLPVDRRKAKRLAHRIRRWARRESAAEVIVTSPLRRAADVGRWLARWGWRHEIDARLSELDFGAWDGRAWHDIAFDEVEAWRLDFVAHAPGDGESLAMLLQRCASFLAACDHGNSCCVVGHAGWISAARWLTLHTEPPSAAAWPRSVAYGARVRFDPPANVAAKIG